VKIKKDSLFALFIIIIGFCLRIYQLGNDGLSNDEASQAITALQPTIRSMIGSIRLHAMPTPLDFFVTRMFSNLGTTEFILRLPAAIWGTLTLTLYFIFIKRYYETKVALFAVWLLTISPLLIQYSQELRFYSSLIFFYALSNLCLFRAVSLSSTPAWLVYGFVTAIGTYFHPYVLLSAFNGFLYLTFFRETSSINYKKIITLSTSTFLCGILFLCWYFYFGVLQKFEWDAFLWNPLLIVLTGFGWLSMGQPEPIFGIWEFLSVAGVVTGLLSVIMKYKKNRLLLSMVIGTFIQIGIIFLLNWIKGYLFLPRQLVHFIPTMIILVAIGYVSLSDYISRLIKRPFAKPLCALLVIAFITLSSVPRLKDYYQSIKSSGRGISYKLREIHRAGEPVFIIPGGDIGPYFFYLVQLQKGQNTIFKEFRPSDWPQLSAAVTGITKTTYLIAPIPLISSKEVRETKKNILKSLEFKECFIPEIPEVFGKERLYIRKIGKD